jgi:hypothetical protein
LDRIVTKYEDRVLPHAWEQAAVKTMGEERRAKSCSMPIRKQTMAMVFLIRRVNSTLTRSPRGPWSILHSSGQRCTGLWSSWRRRDRKWPPVTDISNETRLL